jgi:hypothetical protein
MDDEFHTPPFSYYLTEKALNKEVCSWHWSPKREEALWSLLSLPYHFTVRGPNINRHSRLQHHTCSEMTTPIHHIQMKKKKKRFFPV